MTCRCDCGCMLFIGWANGRAWQRRVNAMSEPPPMPARKAAAAFKKLEKIVKKAERAADAFTMLLGDAKRCKGAVDRAKGRLVEAGAADRARGRKAVGTGGRAA
eukprot:8183457-Pyramimonas_sp.AAC.1